MKALSIFLGFFLVIPTIVSLSAADWPQWRGVNRDGMLHGEPALAQLPAKPAQQWQLPTGKGQGGLALAKGVLVVLSEINVYGNRKEAATAYHAATGKTIWMTPYAPSWQYTNVYGPGPRTAPLIDGNLLFCQSAAGDLVCLSMDGGKILWRKNYAKDFGAKWFGGNAPGSSGTAASRHGNNGQPVTDARHIYAPAGGHNGASLVCLEKQTGKLIWKSGNDYAAYAGLMRAKLAGVEQIVMLTAANMIGYRAVDGKQLWSVPVKTGAARNIVTPVIDGDTVTVASHTVGTFQVRIRNSGSGQVADEVWRNPDVRTNITTPVLVDGHLYGLGRSRGKNSDFVCVNHKTGKTVWQQEGFTDYCSIIVVGKNLLVHGSRGTVTLLEANPARYTQRGRIENASQISWNFPVYSGGILYLKDGLRDGNNKLTALKLR